MLRWIKRAMSYLTRSSKLIGTGMGFSRPMVEALEDRIAPATSLAPPTLLDPPAAIRIDQDSYIIRGTLQEAAKNGVTVQAYADTNANGVYDPGKDLLAASMTVAKKGSSFALPVHLDQNALNQFFIILGDGKLNSPPVK